VAKARNRLIVSGESEYIFDILDSKLRIILFFASKFARKQKKKKGPSPATDKQKTPKRAKTGQRDVKFTSVRIQNLLVRMKGMKIICQWEIAQINPDFY
jgi:hypothetical protein